MAKIEQKYFGSSSTEDDVQDKSGQLSSDTPSLTTQSFAGLFMITGIVMVLALVVSESYIWRKPITLVKVYSQKLLLSPHWTEDNNQPEDESATPGNISGSAMNEANNLPCSPSSASTRAIETLPV